MSSSAAPDERLSADPEDRGYPAWQELLQAGRLPKIILDGVEQKSVLTADAAEGWLRRLVTKADGSPAISGDEFVTEIVRGKVEIIIPETT